ncbi:hypothetical protein [Paraburkholderia rhynchosiae]|uniref:hypothetical protein n=1 Tax=Paraburkholderia rhynchosiae TaxID=487049 RepID=UPI001ABF0CC4|nr:hypothetical protein [Paraburkholderia rhynchosiae]
MRAAMFSRAAIQFSGFLYSLYLMHFSFVLFVAGLGIPKRMQQRGAAATAAPSLDAA